MVMGRGFAGEEEDFDDNPFEDQVHFPSYHAREQGFQGHCLNHPLLSKIQAVRVRVFKCQRVCVRVSLFVCLCV